MRTNPRVTLAIAAAFALIVPVAARAQTAGPDCPVHQAHAANSATPAAAETHAHHEHAMSPYAGKEGSEVKAVSADEMKAYREGTGMGLAKPAELNHYPGPRHALDLRSELSLTASQTADLEAIFNRMHEAAVALGGRIIEEEKALDREFASGAIDEVKLRSLTARIAGLQADLRATHLNAHLETKRILTPLQVIRYDELRGYARPAGS
jgi:Spy/CpxP family protein refolding chaperone